MNDQRQITGLFCGDLEKAHAKGARFVGQQNGVLVAEPVDIAVTSSAGWPLDLTFYQAVKGLTAVLPMSKRVGRSSLPRAAPRAWAVLICGDAARRIRCRRIRGPPRGSRFLAIDQWQLQELCKVLDKAEVMFYSEGIDPQYRDKVWVEVISSVEQGLAAALTRHGTGARIAVVPKALTYSRKPKEGTDVR